MGRLRFQTSYVCMSAVLPLQSPNGFDKTGPYRARFILEALSDLRSRLRDAGSDLVVRIGKPGGNTKHSQPGAKQSWLQAATIVRQVQVSCAS